MIDAFSGLGRWLVLPVFCVALAGCGSSGSSGGGQSTAQTLGNILMFQSTKPPPVDQLPKDEDEPLICPQVMIADGGAAIRAQSGQDSASLRNQISITDVARECTPAGPGGGFRLKVGVQGRVLAGPAGGAGSHSATLVTTVSRGGKQIARRVARVGGTISSGQSATDFTHIEDGIVVPAGSGDVDVEVSLGGAGAAPARARRR